MIPMPSGVRVWLAVGRTDMRRGMNGLALQVQEALRRDPHAGDLRRRYADAPAGAPRGAPAAPAGARRRFPPASKSGLLAAFIFLGAIRDFTNPVAQASNLQTTNLGVRSSNLFGPRH